MSAESGSTTDTIYKPEAGDLIWTDFDPRVGRERSGRRPALVISPRQFFDASKFAIVCPITRTVRNFGSSVILASGLPITGEVLTSHVRSIDTMARPIRFAGMAVSRDFLNEVRLKLALLCGIEIFSR